jgi:3',5'-cyclic AMP phosphodiesterase CpdA
MHSVDVIPVGHVAQATSSSHAVRIVHISDTHLGHTVLTPPRPISGNISIRRSSASDIANQVVDEKGIDAFERQTSSFTESPDDVFHKGGVFLSNVRRARTSDLEIPCGDILVHSGDFDWSKHSGGIFRSNNFEEIVQLMNDFFDRFPHKVKIFVAGNHEACFEGKKLQAVQQRLTSAVYLFNSSFSYEGILFYGTPYTPFRLMTNARSFIRTSRKIAAHWRQIPSKTDVLVTHSPPYGVLDLGVTWSARKMPGLSRTLYRITPEYSCGTCGIIHPGRSHWGCPHLREEVLIRIK